MHLDNDIHGSEWDENDASGVRFDAYYEMANCLRANKDDIVLLNKLYKSIPEGHKFELLIKCASLSSAPQCFNYLFDALYEDLSKPHNEAELAKILDSLMENDCIGHLEQSFERFGIQQCRLVNSVVVGVNKMSHSSIQMVLAKSPQDVAASALNHALTLSLRDQKYYEMVKTISPLCATHHLPDVVYGAMSEYFVYPDKDNSLAVLEDFVTNLEPKTFKKVYQKIHTFVKEHSIESIKARYSKDKMLVQLEGLGSTAEVETTGPRRKM